MIEVAITPELRLELRDGSLAGCWRNQLGSRLTLEIDGRGHLSGTYHAGAGAVPDRTYRVVGSYDPAPFGPVTVLGFVVDWAGTHSLTVWSGQHHAGEGTITATWLMTTETGTEDEWKATMVGHDVFRRDDR